MIEYRYEEEAHRSAAYDGKKQIGECDYLVKGNQWYVVHTQVQPEYRGKGIAQKLVEMLQDQAKKRQKSIVPICTYAKKIIQ